MKYPRMGKVLSSATRKTSRSKFLPLIFVYLVCFPGTPQLQVTHSRAPLHAQDRDERPFKTLTFIIKFIDIPHLNPTQGSWETTMHHYTSAARVTEQRAIYSQSPYSEERQGRWGELGHWDLSYITCVSGFCAVQCKSTHTYQSVCIDQGDTF